MSNKAGTLYIVATPIGNLEDISPRAQRLLSEVDAIAAEDTRHSRKLLDHLGIHTPMFAVHEHNEREMSHKILERLQNGESIALIADAGTPLISDPGYVLVNEARAVGLEVVPVPGASALITALSAAGLPTDRFIFEGFLPSKKLAREKHLQSLAHESRTLVFYESPHRIVASIEAMLAAFGGSRRLVLARELTKRFETFIVGSLDEVLERVSVDEDQQRGEFVIIVAGADEPGTHGDAEADRILQVLLAELPVKQAARLAAQITGLKKNELYARALQNTLEK